MLDKLFNSILDTDGNLKPGIGFLVVVICILLAGIVQGM